MIKRSSTIILLLSFILFSLAPTMVEAQRGDRITEDDPRWDCRTMGNKICGDTKDKKQTYLCGALTKKGTLCKRKVKTAGARCWQHKGK